MNLKIQFVINGSAQCATRFCVANRRWCHIANMQSQDRNSKAKTLYHHYRSCRCERTTIIALIFSARNECVQKKKETQISCIERLKSLIHSDVGAHGTEKSSITLQIAPINIMQCGAATVSLRHSRDSDNLWNADYNPRSIPETGCENSESIFPHVTV